MNLIGERVLVSSSYRYRVQCDPARFTQYARKSKCLMILNDYGRIEVLSLFFVYILSYILFRTQCIKKSILSMQSLNATRSYVIIIIINRISDIAHFPKGPDALYKVIQLQIIILIKLIIII